MDRGSRRGEGRPRNGGRDPRPSWLDRLLGRSQDEQAPPRYVARPLRQPAYPPGERRRGLYGTQARRQGSGAPYAVAFVLIFAVLAAFLYFGIGWATGTGRLAAIGAPPTPVVIPSPSPIAVASPSPSPSPQPERAYVVKAGDNPASIAAQFGITTDALLSADNITDPTKLQVGQTLKIPPPPARGG